MTHPIPESSGSRIEFFSDAVFAILITIMVLELHAPEGRMMTDLMPLLPVFLNYTLSFIYLIIYWNNHHHLLRTMNEPTAKIMWANAHLLFWLSLIPFTTSWLGGSDGEVGPVALYGIVLLGAATAYYLLQLAIIATEGRGSVLAKALGKDFKGKISLVLYLLAIAMAFFSHWISYAIYIIVALYWFIPDRRIQKAVIMHRGPKHESHS